MLDTIVAKDLYNDSGVGCDNMTCIVIVFKKDKDKEKKAEKEKEKEKESEKK